MPHGQGWWLQDNPADGMNYMQGLHPNNFLSYDILHMMGLSGPEQVQRNYD
jgi:hypothetical protein